MALQSLDVLAYSMALQSLDVLAGIPLDPDTRRFMESRFGADFSGVRIHTGATALAQFWNARAFTIGRHIFFDSGQYCPHTAQGRMLLAHELAHVVQRQKAKSILWAPTSPGDACEREAQEAASDISRGYRANVRQWASVPQLQCNKHLKLHFPPLKPPAPKPPSLFPPGALTLTSPKLSLAPLSFRIPRRGPPSLFLPGELTFDLPPVAPNAPLVQFSLPSRGTTGFTFPELESIARPRPDLGFRPIGPSSAKLDPLLFEALRNPSLLKTDPSPPRRSPLSMRDKTTMDVGSDIAFGDNIAFELWVAMVLQADALQLRRRGGGLDLLHQPTAQITMGVPVWHGGSSYVGANIGATLLNFHVFRRHSTDDLFEFGIGQTNLTDQNGKYGLQEAGVIEGHITSKVSIIATGGFNISIGRDGLDTHPSPFFNIGLVFHGPAL